MRRAAFVIGVAIMSSVALRAGSQTLGVPNTGNAPPGGSPIQIEDCTTLVRGDAVLAESNHSFRVVFTNEGAVPADLVRFQIDFGEERLAIRDVGTFSPGVTVTHVFKRRGGNVYTSPLFSPKSLQCSVSAVHFTDNSDWTPGGAARTAHADEANAVTPPTILGDGYLGLIFDPSAPGATVKYALPGSPAQVGGLTSGDIIVQIDGQRSATWKDAVTMISAAPIGSKLALMVDRGGQVENLTVVVGKRPAANGS